MRVYIFSAKRYKARKIDMHAGSNAVQQRFSKQPVSAQVRPLVKLATACHSEGHRPEESIKIQSTKERYALRKHRGSTKVLKAAIAAVKLATACHSEGHRPEESTRT